MFVLMKVRKWEDVELKQMGNYKLPIPCSMVSSGDGCIGFLEVYDTQESAIKAGYNPADLVEVKEQH